MAQLYLALRSNPPATAWEGLDFGQLQNDPAAKLLVRVGNAGPFVPVKQSSVVVGVDGVCTLPMGGTGWTVQLW